MAADRHTGAIKLKNLRRTYVSLLGAPQAYNSHSCCYIE